MATPDQLTELLHEVTAGSQPASDRLFQELYSDLRRLAAAYLKDERSDHTLQATALVHEAYLRLVNQSRVDWKNRSHFFAVAAMAMRRLLVDHARRRAREKRGGGQLLVTLNDDAVAAEREDATIDVLAIDQALARLSEREPEKARLVELRFFGGLSPTEAAEVMGLSQRTVERYWLYARTWMLRELIASEPPGSSR